jgi:RHS repeat-associated protein
LYFQFSKIYSMSFGMLMPGCNSQSNLQGGFSNGTTTVNGSTYVSNLTITTRIGNTPNTYKAANSIEFVGEYVDNGSEEYEAFIVNQTNPDPNPTTGTVSSINVDGYRYGFNGKEKTNEITSEDYDFGERIYDGRLGKWLSVDKLTNKNPGESPYLFTGGNPLAFLDADGNDRVYFNSEGVEIKRIESKTEFITYVEIAAKTRHIKVNGIDMLERSYAIAPMPGVIAGYESAEYQKNDYQIAASTKLFNMKLAAATSPSDVSNAAGKNHTLVGEFPKSIDVNLVKALCMQESHCGTNASMNGKNDIMQVNVGGDWNSSKDAKTAVGMTKGMTIDPSSSLKYGLKVLFLKGFGSDGIDQNPDWKVEAFQDKWTGVISSWLNAIDKYNGGGAAKYGQNYSQMVQDKLNTVTPAQPSNYNAPPLKPKKEVKKVETKKKG